MVTVAVERRGAVGDNRTLMEKFIEALKKMFKKKVEFEEAEKAMRARREAETQEARRREKERRSQEEKQRKYHERQSAEETIESLEQHKQLEAAKVQRLLEAAVYPQNVSVADRQKVIPEADYLFSALRTGNTDQLDELKRAVAQSPGAGFVIEILATKKDVHRDPVELAKLGKWLVHEIGGSEAVQPLVAALKSQVNRLVEQAINLHDSELRSRGSKPTETVPEWLVSQFGAPDLETDLRDRDRWREAVETLITRTDDVGDAQWMAVEDQIAAGTTGTAGPANPTTDLVSNVDAIWAEVEQREKTRPLSVDELQDLERKLRETESGDLPRDVHAGTEAFSRVASANHGYVEKRLDALAAKLAERLRMDKPLLKTGLSPEQFLEAVGENPGRLGHLFDQSPDVKKYFLGLGPEHARFRDQLFLTFHKNILTQFREESSQNFGLYERADMTTFINMLQSGFAKLARKDTGVSVGKTWAEWYTGLSNTIRLSRDLDYIASQPGVDMKAITRVWGIYQNEYSDQALSFPVVEQAYRAYETTLRAIQAANDGYIPPALIEHDYRHGMTYWDAKSLETLMTMMTSGQVYDVKRDEYCFQVVDQNGHTVVISDEPMDLKKLTAQDPQGLGLAMYMTLAKGFGMANFRFLEMLSHAKVPGSIHPVWGMEGFHSTAYEGLVRAFDFFNHVLVKWRFGSYRFMYMMNYLLPEEKKASWREKLRNLDPNMPSREALEVYIAYRDGTFEEKYGSEAKRLLDMTNFSNCAGAFGPPYTSFRHLDASLGWADRDREKLGTAPRIMLRKKFAMEKVKDYLVVGQYKEEFRQAMAQAGLPTSGPEFEKQWCSRGLVMYGGKIEAEWEAIFKDHKRRHHIEEEFVKKYEMALAARVWVEATMRNPLIVAHNLKIKIPNEGFEQDPDPQKRTRKISLHAYIVQQVLGIPLEDTRFGVIPGSEGVSTGATPTEEQKHYMNEVINLEADLAAVREKALREHSDLTENDFFKVIKDRTRAEQALRYWQIVRQVMLGSPEEGRAQQLYDEFGLTYGVDRNYDVDWKKVEEIDKTLEGLGTHSSGITLYDIQGRSFGEIPVQLTEKWAGKNWEWIFNTDDTSYREMDLLNLGARHWLRRAGDVASHYAGGEKAGDYLTNGLGPNPDVEDLGKRLKELRQAYEGDMIDMGWRVASRLAFLTEKLYAWDWTRLGSAAQLDIWKTRRGAAAWMANGRRKFWDTLEHMDVIPPVHETWGYEIEKFDNIHELRKLTHAGNYDVWLEIISLGIALSLAITIYRAFTAKSEEEEEGGGGGHH